MPPGKATGMVSRAGNGNEPCELGVKSDVEDDGGDISPP